MYLICPPPLWFFLICSFSSVCKMYLFESLDSAFLVSNWSSPAVLGNVKRISVFFYGNLGKQQYAIIQNQIKIPICTFFVKWDERRSYIFIKGKENKNMPVLYQWFLRISALLGLSWTALIPIAELRAHCWDPGIPKKQWWSICLVTSKFRDCKSDQSS